MKKYLYLITALTLLFSNCTINTHVMLKTPKDFKFDELPSPEDVPDEYILTKGDRLTFRLFSNDGFTAIDMTAKMNGNGGFMRENEALFYLIREDSLAKLPILGEVNVVGMTISDAEEFLEKEYGKYYVSPFMQMQVLNKRAIVFPGSGGNARVVPLNENSISLMELIASVGGLTNNSRANTIKIIRKTKSKTKIFKIDLSTIDGLSDSEFVIQANDIVYIEPNPNIINEVLRDVAPVFSLVSSTFVTIFTIQRIGALGG